MLNKSIQFIGSSLTFLNDNNPLSISIITIEYNYSIHFLYNSNSKLKLIHVTDM